MMSPSDFLLQLWLFKANILCDLENDPENPEKLRFLGKVEFEISQTKKVEFKENYDNEFKD